MAKGDKLESYRRKRDFGKTAEPAGAVAGGESRARFVIQEHHATRLHWDLRLEHDGVLASWAVPNGIPMDPKENRLAVRTEDHPLEYLEFHGQIPEGSYGAGSMTIWDQGTFELEKWRDVEVMAVFHGERMRGRYVLIRTRDKDWLLHRMDPPVDPQYEPMPERMLPMLRATGELPSGREWAFEIAWDGVRALCFSKPGRMRLLSRSGADLAALFPELRPLNRAFSSHEAVIDGEIVCFGADGKPDPERLARRLAPFASEAALRRASRDRPATYVVYDCLYLDGRSLLERSYEQRRAALDGLERLPQHPAAQVPRYHAGEGAALLEAARAQGLRGIVGKRLDGPYTPGRPGCRVIRAGEDGLLMPSEVEPIEVPEAPDYYARISIWLLPHLRGAQPRIDGATVLAPCAPDVLAWDLPASLAPVLAGMLEHLGLSSLTRTLGDGELQVAVPLNSDTKLEAIASFAKAVVATLDQAGPGARWAGETTVAPYSLCADGSASVPLEPGEEPRPFTPADAIERAERNGDPWAPALHLRQETAVGVSRGPGPLETPAVGPLAQRFHRPRRSRGNVALRRSCSRGACRARRRTPGVCGALNPGHRWVAIRARVRRGGCSDLAARTPTCEGSGGGHIAHGPKPVCRTAALAAPSRVPAHDPVDRSSVAAAEQRRVDEQREELPQADPLGVAVGEGSDF